eukprot:SAG31_NODE_21188_length_555_cov_2.905702_2_plen_91_part_00
MRRVLQRIASSLATANRSLEQFGITIDLRTPSMLERYNIEHPADRYSDDAQAAELPIRVDRGDGGRQATSRTATNLLSCLAQIKFKFDSF